MTGTLRVNRLEYMSEIGLQISGYDENVDPRIANGFAAAALRFGHTLIQPEFERVDKDYKKTYSPVLLRNVSRWYMFQILVVVLNS